MKKLLVIVFAFVSTTIFSQANAHDLIICKSTDGMNWTNNALLQDSSGVPSIAQSTTGVIYCAFQWFPAPATPTNPSHDKIAIKQSSDGGLTWSAPVLANFIGFPGTYKRPFDPTVVLADNGNIRMYFSSSKTGTLMALDSTVHCYSAISPDGINYTYEGVRVLVKDSITIDPAVAKFGATWHYTAPRAAPQDGAHHFISADGMAWTRTTTIASNFNRNWTGNLFTDGSTLNFYGTPNPWTNQIWRNQTMDGFTWAGYVNCVGPVTSASIQADPAVFKVGTANYIMVYCSKQSLLSVNENLLSNLSVNIYPNPNANQINIKTEEKISSTKIFDANGKLIYSQQSSNKTIETHLQAGLYTIEIETEKGKAIRKLIIE